MYGELVLEHATSILLYLLTGTSTHDTTVTHRIYVRPLGIKLVQHFRHFIGGPRLLDGFIQPIQIHFFCSEDKDHLLLFHRFLIDKVIIKLYVKVSCKETWSLLNSKVFLWF